MKKANQKTLSIVPTVPMSRSRITRQTIHILTFIHRFRHVTAKHIQSSLRHARITPTNKQLSIMRAKGLIDRQYTQADKKVNRPASYFITLEGLSLLQAQKPEGKYRGVRSVNADAIMSRATRARYHTLADTYAYFKRHYDGHFEFWSAFDMASVDYMPDEVPDGYIRMNLPDSVTQHYFIEIYGWGRSTQMQQRRLHGYLQFAESERWQTMTGEPSPNLFIVAGSQGSQQRLNAQMAGSLKRSFVDNFHVYVTAMAKLDEEVAAIWREVG